MTVQTLLAASAAFTMLIAGGQLPAVAEDTHHPPTGAAAQQLPGAAQPMQGPQGAGGQPGMMGPGGMPMGGMMGMMGQGGMMMQDMSMPGMHMIDHIEGKIAFLRAELNITDAQARSWDALANALRANAKKLREVRAAMASQGMDGNRAPMTVVQRLDRHESWLAAHLDGVRAIKTALTPLYASLSDAQKKTAENLVRPHMGMMAMGGPNR